MNDQLTLCAPAEGGREIILPQLHARTDDPDTSKRAAKRLNERAISTSRVLFLHTLRAHGPMTVLEASKHTINPDWHNSEWNKRVHSWHVAGHIELTGEERNGSRVWRIKQ